jgi:hypothetical protein
MKNITLISVPIALLLVLTACSADSGGLQPNAANPAGDAFANTPANQPASSTNIAPDSNGAANASTPAMSDETRLIIGTFKLEGTDQAVTAEQAAVLLPLWNALKEIEGSSTPQGNQPPDTQPSNATPVDNSDTQQEIDADIEQIQGAMTTAQLQMIEDMQLTSQGIMNTMQEQGIAMRNPQPGNGDDQGMGTMVPPQGTPSTGEAPGFNGGQSGSGVGPNPNRTPRADDRQDAGRLPPGLIDALIQFLQKKAGS